MGERTEMKRQRGKGSRVVVLMAGLMVTVIVIAIVTVIVMLSEWF